MKSKKLLIAPSILSGDFGRLAEEAKRIEEAGADCIHVDIMDGHFVPNLTLGPKALAAINRATNLFLDVHIMIYNPFDFIERFVENGADRITFHFEATEDVEEIISYIRKCNVQAGLAFRPETGVDFSLRFVGECDLMLLMTVPPGFGGQTFRKEVVEKVRLVAERAKSLKSSSFLIQVDGGIDEKTAPLCVKAGANVLVAGTYLFEGGDMKEKMAKLRSCGE